MAPFFCSLDALSIDDGGGRTGLTTFGLAQRHDQIMADGLPHSGIQESSKITIHRRPGRKAGRRWQVAPLATSAHDVEQAIQHAPHVSRAGALATFRRRDERLDQAVLIIAQRLTGAKTSN